MNGVTSALTARRIGWRRFERASSDEMRALYRRDKGLWVDLVEQAAVMDVVLVGAEASFVVSPWPRRVASRRAHFGQACVGESCWRSMVIGKDELAARRQPLVLS